MVATSLGWSFTPITSSAKPRRVNRYSSAAMASASVSVDNVKVTQGLGNLPKIDLTSVHGSEAEIYLFGGCITSWKVANKDLLFVRPDAVFDGKKPISGGVPHCFPQFGPGAIQQHGFARNVNWSLVNSENVEGNPAITLELKDSPYSRSMWDYSFLALYKVTLDRNTLSTELTITNTDEKSFSFTSALHTYFRASVTEASVTGLRGCKTLNKDPDPKSPVEGKEERDILTFPGFVDCIYLDAPQELQLDNGLGNKITIKNTNFQISSSCPAVRLRPCCCHTHTVTHHPQAVSRSCCLPIVHPPRPDRRPPKLPTARPTQFLLPFSGYFVARIVRSRILRFLLSHFNAKIRLGISWSDTVLWNPHLSMEACYEDFVCVENAKIGQVQLEPNQSWTATQLISLA